MRQSTDPTGTHATLSWHTQSIDQTGDSLSSSLCFHLCQHMCASVRIQTRLRVYVYSLFSISDSNVELHLLDWAGLGSDVGGVRIVLASMDVELAVCMQHLQEDQCCKTINVDCNMNDTIFLLITSWLSIFAHTMRVPQATSLNELAVPGAVCTCCLQMHAGPASVGLLRLAACVFLHGVRACGQPALDQQKRQHHSHCVQHRSRSIPPAGVACRQTTLADCVAGLGWPGPV